MQQLHSAALQDRSGPEFWQQQSCISAEVVHQGAQWEELVSTVGGRGGIGAWGQSLAFPGDRPPGLQPHAQ